MAGSLAGGEGIEAAEMAIRAGLARLGRVLAAAEAVLEATGNAVALCPNYGPAR